MYSVVALKTTLHEPTWRSSGRPDATARRLGSCSAALTYRKYKVTARQSKCQYRQHC